MQSYITSTAKTTLINNLSVNQWQILSSTEVALSCGNQFSAKLWANLSSESRGVTVSNVASCTGGSGFNACQRAGLYLFPPSFDHPIKSNSVLWRRVVLW